MMMGTLYRRLREESRIPWLLFYAGLTIELLVVIIDKSNCTNPIEGYLFRITFLLFAAKILLTKYDLKEWAVIFAFEAVGLISYRITGANDIIRIVTFVAACKDIPLRQMLKYTFYVTLAGCVVIVFLSVTGIYGDISLTQAYGRQAAEETRYVGEEAEEETRYTLGMGHPNALSCMFFMLAALGVYIWFDRMKWYFYLFLMVLNVGVYLLSGSKTSMIITTAFIAGAFVMSVGKKLREKKFVYLCGLLILALCIGFSVDAAFSAQRVRDAQWNEFFYENPRDNAHIVALGRLDRFLSGRIVTLTDSAQNDGMVQTWSLFSREENMEYYFDMGWVKLFYRYGVIPGILYLAVCLALLWQFYRKKDGCGLVLFAAFAVYTGGEAHLISPYIGRNYLLMIMGSVLWLENWGMDVLERRDT